MLNRLFDQGALLWRILSTIVDFVGLSIFWAALCLPVVTIGPATAALYYTVVKVFRQKEDDAFKMMWLQFKGNLKRGIPATLICIPVAAAAYYFSRVMADHSDTDMGIILFVAYYVMMIIPVGTILYLFPIMGRFSLGLKELFSTSFRLAFKHLPSTIIIVLLNIELINVTLQYWIPILVTPAAGALATSLFLERIFPQYLSVEERAVFANKTIEEIEEEDAEKLSKKRFKK